MSRTIFNAKYNEADNLNKNTSNQYHISIFNSTDTEIKNLKQLISNHNNEYLSKIFSASSIKSRPQYWDYFNKNILPLDNNMFDKILDNELIYLYFILKKKPIL
jgi:hypothetical protein